MASKFRNAGQTCVCANRIYVHERVQATVCGPHRRIGARLRVGDPMSDQTQVGPLVDQQGVDKVARMSMMRSAKARRRWSAATA